MYNDVSKIWVKKRQENYLIVLVHYIQRRMIFSLLLDSRVLCSLSRLDQNTKRKLYLGNIQTSHRVSFVFFPLMLGLQFFNNYKLSCTRMKFIIFLLSSLHLLIVWCKLWKRQQEGIDNVKILIVSHLWKLLKEQHLKISTRLCTLEKKVLF